MVSPEAHCLNFVSPECVRRGEEGGKKEKKENGWVINFSCSFNRLCKLMAIRLPPGEGKVRFMGRAVAKEAAYLVVKADDRVQVLCGRSRRAALGCRRRPLPPRPRPPGGQAGLKTNAPSYLLTGEKKKRGEKFGKCQIKRSRVEGRRRTNSQ